MPVSDISSVRGIGVAVSVSTSTFVRISLMRSLCCTPNRCSSSTTSRPRSLNVHVVGEQAVRADDDVDGAVAHALARPRSAPSPTGSATAPRRAPDSSRSARGTSGRAGSRAAWWARGSRPACRRTPPWPRRATRPRSCRSRRRRTRAGPSGSAVPCRPWSRRSPCAWSGVSSYGNASSIWCWNGVSGRERVARRREPAAVEHDELARDVAHRACARRRASSPSRRRPSSRASAPRRRCTCG